MPNYQHRRTIRPLRTQPRMRSTRGGGFVSDLINTYLYGKFIEPMVTKQEVKRSEALHKVATEGMENTVRRVGDVVKETGLPIATLRFEQVGGVSQAVDMQNIGTNPELIKKMIGEEPVNEVPTETTEAPKKSKRSKTKVAPNAATIPAETSDLLDPADKEDAPTSVNIQKVFRAPNRKPKTPKAPSGVSSLSASTLFPASTSKSTDTWADTWFGTEDKKSKLTEDTRIVKPQFSEIKEEETPK
jgi:hypothetical protein